MPNTNILQHYATLHAAYLHAMGEQGTEYLLEHLPLHGTERVLELGFGTGATMVKLKSRFPKLALSGLEADPGMLAAATARLRFCRLAGQVELLLQQERERIPEGSSDLVYVESVLAILDESTFTDTLGFLLSILKPGGLLAVNESIWHSNILPSEIQAINSKCLQKFGIIQCSEHMAGVEKTGAYFEQFGFKTLSATRMGAMEKPPVTARHIREYASRLYTLLGKARLWFQPKLWKTHARYSSEMQHIFDPGREYLSGTLLLFQKV
ncbi:MAG: methyltransferase domain-containing protein [Lewinellaceae bacterium]|nr:methyltransferase domain-containing protein [Saprospiraceae bacterium]MCB9329822.1 methyltransferase domain-containing protein [Lewinellaceae bacterium]